MLGQTIPEQFAAEGLLVSYFIILTLGIELGLFFIVQKLTRKERSPTWILTFSVTMFAFSAVYFLRALNDLVYGGSSIIADSLYQVDFIIVSASGIVIGVLMRAFFKNGKKLLQQLSIVVIILGLVSLVFNIYSMINAWDYSLVFAALAVSLLIPVASFPIYILSQLAKRDESGYKSIFIMILLGVILNFIGLALNFQRVQAILVPALATAYPDFKIAVLVIIIAGLAMITFGFFFIPPVDDFFSVNQLVGIYVLDKTTRVALFKKIYDQKVIDGFSFGGTQSAGNTASESVFVSGIGGITEMLSEAMAGGGKKVELIDQGLVKLLLSYEGNLIFMLLVKQAMPLFNSKLKSFQADFLLFFGDMLSRFASNPEKFLPAETIASRIFGTAGDTKR
jgi:hypothetical protein